MATIGAILTKGLGTFGDVAHIIWDGLTASTVVPSDNVIETTGLLDKTVASSGLLDKTVDTGGTL